MITHLKLVFTLTLIFGGGVPVLIAQNGIVKGTVTAEGEPVEMANIALSETGMGGITDSSGEFTIDKVPEGDYKIIVSLIGYAEYEKAISVKDGRTVKLEVPLQEQHSELEEVVVTGVTRATKNKDNPVPVKSMGGEQLHLQNETNVMDAIAMETPGMSVLKTGPNVSKPYIRGLGYNRVLTLFDGIRQEGQQWGDEHGLELDDYNIDHVEVIKGPSSLMYGSDALAGVVSIFPNVPEKEDGKLHGEFTSEVQSNNGMVGNALRIGYNDGKYIFGASGSFKLANNYRNPVDGRVYQSNFKTLNFSTMLGIQSDKGYTHLKFTLYDDKQGIPEGDRDVEGGTRRFTREYFGYDNDRYGEFVPVGKSELSTYKLPDLHQRIQHYRAYVHSKYDIGEGSFDALLAGEQNIRTEFDHPETPAQQAMKVRLNTLNYSFRYDAPEFANIETSIGINGMLQDNKSIDASDFPIPNYNQYEGGLFVYGKWQKSDWTISGGIRYDLGKIKWGDFWIDKHPVTGFDEHISAPRSDDSELLYERTRKSFNGLTASIGTTYEINDHLNLKANFGRAYREPNINELASDDLDPGASIVYHGNIDFDPEFSMQEDMTFQADYNDFTVELSGFHNHIKDFIYLSRGLDDEGDPAYDDEGNKEYDYLQASAMLYGGELWFSAHPQFLQGFKFDNTFSYTRGLNRDPHLKQEGTNGEYLPNIAPFKWIGTVSREFRSVSKLFRLIKPQFGIELAAAQNEYFGRNDTETHTPGYTLFNLGVQAQIKYSDKMEPLTFMVKAENLFNRAYQDHLNRLKYMDTYRDEGVESPDGRYGIYDMGRNVTFKLMIPF